MNRKLIFVFMYVALSLQSVLADNRHHDRHDGDVYDVSRFNEHKKFRRTEVGEIGKSGTTRKGQCQCRKDRCFCCVFFSIESPVLPEKEVCLVLMIDIQNMMLHYALLCNRKVILQRQISVNNPPPICVRVPLTRSLKICIEFYGIQVSTYPPGAKACMQIRLHVAGLKLIGVNFGCMQVGGKRRGDKPNPPEIPDGRDPSLGTFNVRPFN